MRLVDDPDFTLIVGDVRERLRDLPDESVHCVVTSPPYWGLRDYGTGEWEGGDAGCEHSVPLGNGEQLQAEPGYSVAFRTGKQYTNQRVTGNVCKCGARRSDRQLGLEATPELYVENMVEVFREVRRVLRRDGTCWLNLGDSYQAHAGGAQGGSSQRKGRTFTYESDGRKVEGLKPKDLVGIPWRVAFALQADGWYLRSDIVWSKPNPMPESVTDRPTKAHEYVFLLTREPRYWYDADAVREPHAPGSVERIKAGFKDRYSEAASGGYRGAYGGPNGEQVNPAGRNLRSVWEISTQPYPEAHFATFPEALVERCLKAGCPEWVCRTCGEARRRITDGATYYRDRDESRPAQKYSSVGQGHGNVGRGPKTNLGASIAQTLGFTDCGHDDYGPGTVLDPFLGSGTTALVARRLGRRCVGIELSPEYAALAAKRLQQLSLFAGVA